MAKKKLAIIVLVAALLSLALAPESLACRRHYSGYRSRPAAYYYVPRSRVAGVAYSHHGHSTRNKILTVHGPAAGGAGTDASSGPGRPAGRRPLVRSGRRKRRTSS